MARVLSHPGMPVIGVQDIRGKSSVFISTLDKNPTAFEYVVFDTRAVVFSRVGIFLDFVRPATRAKGPQGVHRTCGEPN